MSLTLLEFNEAYLELSLANLSHTAVKTNLGATGLFHILKKVEVT